MVWTKRKSTRPYIYQHQYTAGYKEKARLLILKIFKVIMFKTGEYKKKLDQQRSMYGNCPLRITEQ